MLDKVCVVMSTYNGERFLKEQLESIFSQNGVDVFVFVRDDGSQDKSISILDQFDDSRLSYEVCENCGAKISFLRALADSPDADYYAFADQDDVWDTDKLISAVNMIKKSEIEFPDKPVLYSGRTRLVDQDLNPINISNSSKHKNKIINPFLRGQTLSSAGCTMVFNRNLKMLASSYLPTVFPMHDAWMNLLCLATGGVVLYDPVPHISYRQHGNNVVGGKRGLISSIKRRISFNRRMGKCYHTKMYKELYDNFNSFMPAENIERYKFVISYKDGWKSRLKLLSDKDFFRGDNKYKFETRLLVFFNCY